MRCIFCDIVAGTAECSRVYEDDQFMAFMDIYPWRPGHVLVIPKQHAQHVHEMDSGAPETLFGVGLRIGNAIRSGAVPCDDLHYMVNDGRAANQSVPHVHLHVLPRRRGDLWRLVGQLLKRPALPLLRPAGRSVLDDQAAAIRCALD